MASKRNRLTSTADAVPSDVQHDKPCHDCPFARTALPGWLGGYTVDQYVALAHSDLKIDCHAIEGPQCAGAAIYRANVAKKPRDPSVLRLPADPELVFATPMEFIALHSKGPAGAADDAGG